MDQALSIGDRIQLLEMPDDPSPVPTVTHERMRRILILITPA